MLTNRRYGLGYICNKLIGSRGCACHVHMLTNQQFGLGLQRSGSLVCVCVCVCTVCLCVCVRVCACVCAPGFLNAAEIAA